MSAWLPFLYLAWTVVCVVVMHEQHGKKVTINFGSFVLWRAVAIALLYWGGFFDVLLR